MKSSPARVLDPWLWSRPFGVAVELLRKFDHFGALCVVLELNTDAVLQPRADEWLSRVPPRVWIAATLPRLPVYESYYLIICAPADELDQWNFRQLTESISSVGNLRALKKYLREEHPRGFIDAAIAQQWSRFSAEIRGRRGHTVRTDWTSKDKKRGYTLVHEYGRSGRQSGTKNKSEPAPAKLKAKARTKRERKKRALQVILELYAGNFKSRISWAAVARGMGEPTRTVQQWAKEYRWGKSPERLWLERQNRRKKWSRKKK